MRTSLSVKTIAALSALLLSGNLAAQKGPVMGWSSWNTYRVNISDTLIMRQADALVSTGLKDAGYTYVNIDDGFFGYRDEQGEMQPHPQRFPGGMKRVADYIHSLGLKAGIYSDAGALTCGSIWDKDRSGIGAGLYGHEEQDARLYIRDSWGSVKHIVEKCMPLSAYCADGHFNDMDMLEIGRSLTPSEERVHFGLWCLMSSPLLIGCDLTTIPEHSLRLLKNEELIALNQDPLHLQAYPVQARKGTYVLVKDILQRRGTVRTVALYNSTDSTQHIAIPVRELELSGKLEIKDLIAPNGETYMTYKSHKTHTASADSIVADLPPHDVTILRVEAERRLEPTRYEAEWAYLPLYNDLGKRKKEIHYAPCSEASGEMVVRYGGGSRENSIQWPHVYSRQGGTYNLTIYYLTAENRGLELIVNGETVKRTNDLMSRCTDETTSNERTDKAATLTVPVTLTAGDNLVELTCPTAWLPDIDKIELQLSSQPNVRL